MSRFPPTGRLWWVVTRITAISPRGVATAYDVPGSIEAIAGAIAAAQRGTVEVTTYAGDRAGVRVGEIVMLQLLDFDRPVLQPDSLNRPAEAQRSRG